MSYIQTQLTDSVLVLTLNRPELLNAFNEQMIDDWYEALVEAKFDERVKVVVVTGAGKAFCTGIDVRALEMTASALENKQALSEGVHKIPLLLKDYPKPIITAINGLAIGAGLDMALMTDIRTMAQSAKISEGYIKVGLVPGDGGAYYLPKIVGTAKALELLWTGRFVDATEAQHLNIVSYVFRDDELLEQTLKLAHSIAQSPVVAVSLIKRAVYQAERLDVTTALDLISSHFAVVRDTDFHRAAVAQIIKKEV